MPRTIPLDVNWSFANTSSLENQREWLGAAQVPTTVHVELIRLGKIADPFKGMNEWEVQCMFYLVGSIMSSLTA